MSPSHVLGLLVAALGGAAVGLEREWSGHTRGRHPHFAGIRTFTMLGAVAGISGWLWASGGTWLAAILLGGGVALTVAGYVRASRHDVDGTTEVAALIVLGAGVLAGMGDLRLASGIIAIEILLLVEKSRLHGWVRRIADLELRAAVRFGAMALVVLPLLPSGPFGPLGGVRPRELWALVLFFSGLSFVGHVLRRIAGPGQGYLLAGLVGGLLSSTNVTWTYARMSRTEPGLAWPLALGAVGANAVLYPRVLTAVVVLNARLAPVLLPYLVAPAVIAAAIAIAATRLTTRERDGTPEPVPRNPLQLRSALQMAVLFQLVLMAVHLAREMQGAAGVYASAAVLGLTDVDALTLSMARGVAREASLHTAAVAIAIGILANTLLKGALAVVFGAPTFRLVCGGALVLMAVAMAATIHWLP
jgi:uncharacterized membrane protein (DUF4010 family)